MNRNMTRSMARKSVLTLTAIILALASFVGSTVAYLVDASGSISSLAVLSPYVAVEFPEDVTPHDSQVARYALNASYDYSCYFRVKFEVVWTNGIETDDVAAHLGYDYEIIDPSNNWKLAEDGYWYYVCPIEPSFPGMPSHTPNITLGQTADPPASDYTLGFVVISYEGVRADDTEIVKRIFSSGVSGVGAYGRLLII